LISHLNNVFVVDPHRIHIVTEHIRLRRRKMKKSLSKSLLAIVLVLVLAGTAVAAFISLSEQMEGISGEFDRED